MSKGARTDSDGGPCKNKSVTKCQNSRHPDGQGGYQEYCCRSCRDGKGLSLDDDRAWGGDSQQETGWMILLNFSRLLVELFQNSRARDLSWYSSSRCFRSADNPWLQYRTPHKNHRIRESGWYSNKNKKRLMPHGLHPNQRLLFLESAFNWGVLIYLVCLKKYVFCQ